MKLHGDAALPTVQPREDVRAIQNHFLAVWHFFAFPLRLRAFAVQGEIVAGAATSSFSIQDCNEGKMPG
jgi:hypothetical protein